MISAKIFATVALLFGAVAAGGIFLIENASASDTDRRSSLIERIAAKFNLNSTEVGAVLDEERDTRRTEMKARFEERLAEAVRNGKINDTQKSLILEKHGALVDDREALKESWKNMTREDRKTTMEKRQEELKSWMKTNNIPEGIFGLGMGMGKMGRGGHGTECAGK